MNKILWLPSWYPSKADPFTGDFIQRHAAAVALCRPVHVIFVVKDKNANGKTATVSTVITGNLTETIAYIKPLTTGIGPVDKIISFLKHITTGRQLVKEFISKEGAPAIVHVHVALWAGLTALWIKAKFKIPYLVTEHWTGYQKKATDNVYNRGFFFRKSLKKVLQNAAVLLPVGDNLGKLINHRIVKIPYSVIPNTVDTRYFTFSSPSTAVFRFIHISGMNFQKNCEGILRTFAELILYKNEVELVMVGPAGHKLKALADSLGLQKHVLWTGEISYREVAIQLGHASCLVMFSRFENLPCVILEALCCGLPVISTNVGDVAGVVNNTNGLLVKSENDRELLEAMKAMIIDKDVYNRRTISENAKCLFNYQVIGNAIVDEYSKLSQY